MRIKNTYLGIFAHLHPQEKSDCLISLSEYSLVCLFVCLLFMPVHSCSKNQITQNGMNKSYCNQVIRIIWIKITEMI